MTDDERAEYLEAIAEKFGDGFCKEQVLRQAKTLRERAAVKIEYEKLNEETNK